MPMPEPGPFREPDRPGRSRERLMWVTPDRLFYAGLLGAPSMHAKGALLVYVALDGPLRIRTGTGPWQAAEVAVVQPYVPHQAACDARHVVAMYVEPETVDLGGLPAFLRCETGAVEAPDFADHVRRCHRRWVAAGRELELLPHDFDRLVFGHGLDH